MYLFVDTETSGLLQQSLPLASPEQPWIVSLAAELTDAKGDQLAILYTPIRANGRSISDSARYVHGISSALAGRSGVSELAALGVLCGRESFASQARYCIGHGVSFDRDVVRCVLARHGREATTWVRPGLEFVDTLLAAAPFCQIPSPHERGGYKWPSLDEACEILLKDSPRIGKHNPLDDLIRTKRLYWWLRERNAFDVAEAA